MELFLVWIVCAVFTGVIASSKGRSGGGWFFLAMFFSLFALIAICAMPRIEKDRR